jgi:hypothetical protein
METQNLRADGNGRYTAMLGATLPDGLPAEPFTSGQAHWVGVQVEGQPGQPRVLLVSAPYALKAGDAETIGGLPPSAFLLAAPAGSAPASTAATGSRFSTDPATTAADYVPIFINASGTLADSVIYQSGAKVGINTTSPSATLQVNGTVRGAVVNAETSFDIGSAVFASGNSSDGNAFLGFGGNSTMTGGSNTASGVDSLAGNTTGSGNTASGRYAMSLNTTGIQNTAIGEAALSTNQTGNLNTALGFNAGPSNSAVFDNSTAVGANAFVTESNALVLGSIAGLNGATSNVNVGIGTSAPAYALDVSGTGNFTGPVTFGRPVTFAAGQAFPGTGAGTVTSVGSGTGLTGGPITGSGTLSLASNACASGSALSALPFTCSPFATLGANTFTGNQTVSGNLSATGTVQGSVVNAATSLNIGGNAEIQDGGFGTGNFAAGLQAGFGGGSNTAVGDSAMYGNTGSNNTAVGIVTLGGGICGSGSPCNRGNNNTAIGSSALALSYSGSNNTATGYLAMSESQEGSNNTATGSYALEYNITGNNNTAVGASALQGNITGNNNTGSNNTATGYEALEANTAGGYNTATGDSALAANTTGSYNAAIGVSALQNNVSGSSNIAIGNQAGKNITGSQNIDIGNTGLGNDGGVIRIGIEGTQTAAFVSGIYGVNANGIPVYINSSGQLGTVSSSRRYKEDIQDMGDASDGLMRLRPVTFRYKKPFTDGSQPMQYGLIAEEVAEVYPDLVARSADGQIETVKYQLLDPMLLNELQKQKEQIRSLEERLAKLEAALERTTVTAASR